jgi:hypothetical protein
MSWSTVLKEPVPLPEGGVLKSLHDVRAHVLSLPESERNEDAWHTVAETLLNAADHGGPWLDFARIATMQALYRHAEPKYGPGKTVGPEMKFSRRRKLARDR